MVVIPRRAIVTTASQKEPLPMSFRQIVKTTLLFGLRLPRLALGQRGMKRYTRLTGEALGLAYETLETVTIAGRDTVFHCPNDLEQPVHLVPGAHIGPDLFDDPFLRICKFEGKMVVVKLVHVIANLKEPVPLMLA